MALCGLTIFHSGCLVKLFTVILTGFHFGFTFQPAEFMKFALILFLALRFADKDFIRGDIGKLSQYSQINILKYLNCFHY